MLLTFPWWRMLIGLSVLAMITIVAASQGSVDIPPVVAIEIVLNRLPLVNFSPTWPESWDTILWKLRLPRVTLAILVGAALAISGATYQGLFRNPLADPYLIGVASGAGLGATIVLLTGVPLYFQGLSLLPIAAFSGAITAVTFAYMVARRSEGVQLTTLILAGVAITSLTGALTSLIMLRSDPDLRPVMSWLLGGFISAQWKHSVTTLYYLVPSVLVVFAYGRILNVIQLNEEHARQLGINLERTKVILIVAATLSTAVAVSFSGPIGFVGLVAPHAVRLLWGGEHRSLLPMAAIVGSAFLVLADLVARTIVTPAELPVGLVTAFCGAPFFLYLLRRRRLIDI